MQFGPPTEARPVTLIPTPRQGLLLALIFSIFAGSLSADRFRGHVRHEFLENQPIAGAKLEMVDANDPTQSDTVLSDALGFFETSAFDAGDEIEIIALHPAYQRETPTVTLSTADHFESVLMTPLGNVVEDYHDLMVQVTGAVTQLPLRNVPVEITQWDQSNAVVATYNIVTDVKGIAIQRGVPTGSYEFKINDSSLPDANRQPRYEDYSTPLLGRVDISQNNFTNVYLKPFNQDLKVRVRGYDFEEKESDAALENVLVEIRGLDPFDTNLEVLHPRSDFTVIFPEGQGGVPGPGESIDDSLFYLDNGEVVFKDLPPAAYEVKVSRYGYITQRILLQPDADTGLLPNSYDHPLEVTLPAEGHGAEILLEFEDFLKPVFNSSGRITDSGVYAVGLKVRMAGLEGTNTEGLEFESTTVQNLNGETYAPIFEPLLSGRYRVFVDGISEETNFKYDEVSEFYFPTGPNYDVASAGQSIVEIPAGRTSVSPVFHRLYVPIKTPKVAVRGQLIGAESVSFDAVEPIFGPMANQTIVLEPNPVEVNQSVPEATTVTTDGEGYFHALVLPGAYGIRLPGMTDYFGDEVIVRVGNAAREIDANTSKSYQWPLADAFPELPGATNLQAYRYFELEGLPIHAGREQFLELRVRREAYMLTATGTESTDFNQKVIAITSDNTVITADYSPTLALKPTATLTGSTGSFNTSIVSPPQRNFARPLYARWENLPPGEYNGDSFTTSVVAHELVDGGYSPKTFFDWPEPGAAPSAEQAALFDLNNIPNNELPWEPLEPVPGPFFQINMTDYDSESYDVYDYVERFDENNEPLGGTYEYFGASGSGFMSESSIAEGYFVGPLLGGPVDALWTFNRTEDGESFPVRMTAGGRINVAGSSPTPATPLPKISYTLQLEGVADTDHATKINGAKYQLGSGANLTTGTPEPGITEAPVVTKATGDNFVETFQTPFRVIDAGNNPTIAMTVGLTRGMEINATLRDMTPIGSQGNPVDIPAASVPVTVRDRYGNLIKTQSTNAEGEVKFEALPGLADYFLTLEQSGFSPIRRLLPAAEAMDSTDASTAAVHTITQDITLLDRPTLVNPGVPHNRWGLFLPTVSRSGDVDVKEGINNFDFFSASEALTTKWEIVATPHQLNITLPSYAGGDGSYGDPETLTGPDNIVAAYLIDERRFQGDGFTGSTDLLEGETAFAIPADDEPSDIAKVIKTIRSATDIQGVQNGSAVTTSLQRRVFVDPADTITIDPETGQTTVKGSFALWDIPPGEFDPVIVLETQRGAYKVYDVPYAGDDANKRLRGPKLPPWFANILDLLGVASGIAATQGSIEESLEDYVPEGSFIPLPDFSLTVAVDKEDDDVDEGYLKYALTLAMAQEIGQDSKSEGLLAMGPGIIGAETKVEGKLETDGKAGTIGFTIGGSITKENLIDEAYGTKIAPIGGSVVSFENPTGIVSTTASTNFGIDPNTSDPLKFNLTASAGVAATAKVSATLNNYARGIPYAGPVIGFLGDTDLAKLDAFITGSAAIKQSFTLATTFPRENKQTTRPRTEAVPQQSFLGETTFDLSSKLCIGVGFSTGLELTAALGFAEANVKFEVGGAGCEVSEDISTMELTINPTGGWPFINKIKGEAKVTAEASAGVGPAAIKGKWEFAKAEFEVQFGTETVVTHFPFNAEFLLPGDLAGGEGIFTTTGPDLVSGLAAASNFNVNGSLTDTLAYTAESAGVDVLRIAQRTSPDSWSDPIEIPLGPNIGISTTLTLGDGRTLVAYTVIANGQDPLDRYSDYQIFGRIIETDGTVGPETYVSYISNPPTELVLAESGSVVELHVKAPATDGTQNFWQLFLIPFDPTNSTWGSTAFRVNETESFDLHVASGGPNGADEIVAHWVTGSGDWRFLRTAETSPQTVSGSFAAAPATWATAGFYEIVVPTRAGELQRYGQVPFSGGPGLSSTLAEDITPVEVAITQQSVGPAGGFLTTWANRSSDFQDISYLTYEPDGNVVTGPTPITRNPSGVYSDLLQTQQNATSAYLFARYTNDGFSALRFFAIDMVNGLADNDADDDDLPDALELRIVDSDPDDDIETVDHVLDGDDFDNDGATNGDEIRAGSDPTNPFSLPTPPEITAQPVDATVNAGESANFTVVADGDNLIYEWRHNGSVVPGADQATITIASANTPDAGIYDVTVSNDNGGLVRSDAVRLTINGGDNLPSLVSGVLGTTALGEEGLAHVPFRVDGDGPKRMLFRALGPLIDTVSDSGQSTVDDPWLILRDRTGAKIDENDDWEEAPDSGAEAQSASTAVGAIPLIVGELDAALVAEVTPGNYTLETGAKGPGLIYIEVFDLDGSNMPVSRVASVGMHSSVAAEGFTPTLGFTVTDPGNRDLVSRYLGPALGSTANLTDPGLELFTGSTPITLIGANDDWEAGNLPNSLADLLRGIPLTAGGIDAARVDRLVSGTYLLNAVVPTGDAGLGMLELIDPLSVDSPDEIAVVVPARDQSVTAGSATSFSVLATSPSELSYQWKLADQNVSGATTALLQILDAQPVAEGAYTLEISDGNETIITAPVTLTVLGGGPVRAAQSAGPLTIPPGGTTTFTVEIEWDETPAALSYTTTLPDGWTLQSETAASASSAPSAEATGELVWAFGMPTGDGPISFTFTAQVPADSPGPVQVFGIVSHEGTPSSPVTSEALPYPLDLAVSRGSHDADTNQDFRIDLSELLRVIELYNTRFGTNRTGAYRLQEGTADGFTPDATTTAPGTIARYHSADTDQDAKISLSELLRVIEIYNTRTGTSRTGSYRAADGTPDGFTPDP